MPNFIILLQMKTPVKKISNNPEYAQTAKKCNGKCVCEICTCGKDHCPERPLKFQGQTQYHHDYKPYNISYQKPERTIPEIIPRHYDPQMLKSNYESAYTPYKIDKARPLTQRGEYQPSKVKLEGQTQYNKNFISTPIKALRLNTEPNTYIANPYKFDGTTTYNREYMKKNPVEPPSPSKKREYKQNKIPFSGKSMYETQYQPIHIEPVQSMKSLYRQQQPNFANNAKFEGQSRYRQFYQPYKIAKKQHCPIRDFPPRPSRCSPGKDHLVYSATKDGWI